MKTLERLDRWEFGERSLEMLEGVDEELRHLCLSALAYSPVDFGIIEGLRTEERQAELVAAGKSKTMASLHLTGRAVDIACYTTEQLPGNLTKKQLTWEPAAYIQAVDGFRHALRDHVWTPKFRTRWGAAWHIQDIKMRPRHEEASDWVEEYKAEARAAGRSPFLDFVHFEIHHLEE